MKPVRALYRSIGTLLLLIITAIVIILSGWWPLKIRKISLATWAVHLAARALLKLLNVPMHVVDAGKLDGYAGFIFSNHTSYMDPVVNMAFTPVRFVAKASIRYWPFIGFFAKVIGCLFVDRKNRQDRKATRQALEKINPFPPIILYPEGKTAPVRRLLPFRHGAFEIAQDGGIPYRLCPIAYSDPSLVDWKSRSPWLAAWEIFSRQRPLHATMYVLDDYLPQPDEPSDQLAHTARQKMLAVLVEHGNYINE